MEKRGLFCSTILALLCLQSVRMAHGESACPNQYVYTQQPPEEVTCNPYRGRTLRMECSVVGPNVGEIRWYFSTTSSTFDENTNLLTSSTKYTLVPVTITNGAGVRLTVHNLTEERDAGYYWCQAYVSGSSQMLSESTVFILREQSAYFDFKCTPGVILRNSNTRCATLMEVPTESSTDLVAISYSTANPTSTFDVQPSMSSVHSSLSITLPSVVATTTQLQSSDASSSTLSPVPTLMVTITTDSSSTDFNTASTPTEQSTTVTFPRNPSQSSELILYAVLGLVGFLILICVSLAVVILILCRKRCQRIGLEGSEVKEAGFDRLSNHSDLLTFKRRAAHTPYHPDITMQVSSSSQSRNGSGEYAEIGPALFMLQSRHHETLNSSHDYSEIPELPPERRRTNHMATTTELQQTGSETLMEGTNSENPYDLPVLSEEPEEPENVVDAEEDPVTRTDPEVQSPDPHKYHILEEPPIDSDSSKETPVSDGILPVSSPTSPHSYHVLEGPPSDAQYLCHSHAEGGIFQLQTIPEHPYHVLEEGQTLSSQIMETDPSTFRNSQTLKEATPGFTDPEVCDETFDSNDPKSDLENREYDRLVGPQHLYHILEKSSSALRPVICEFPLTGYTNLDHQAIHPPQTHASCHLLEPKTDESVVSSKSESSTDSSFEAAFDDPQYLISPRRRPINIKAKSDVESHCRRVYANGRFEGYTQAVDLTKYLGDYERDPSYVALLHKRSTDKSSEVSCRDHHTRRSSLPDLPHVYQALESTTMDPRQQYERLRKQQDLASTETAI